MSEVERRIRVLEVIDADSARTRRLRVFCIRTARTIDIEECRTCPNNVDVAPERVRCDVPDEPDRLGPNAPAALVSIAHVTCARADARAAALMSVVQPPWLVPLVDETDRFVGFVSSSSLATSTWPSRVAILMRLRDLAFGSSLMIHESATVREALHMMAYRRTRWIAVVDSDGKAAGHAVRHRRALGSRGHGSHLGPLVGPSVETRTRATASRRWHPVRAGLKMPRIIARSASTHTWTRRPSRPTRAPPR